MIDRFGRSPRREEGFTLIELLVVMMIIGVLAAIAIPSFVNQKSKARVSAAKSDAHNFYEAATNYYLDHTGALPANAYTPPTSSSPATLVVDGQTVTFSGTDGIVASGNSTDATGDIYCAVIGTGTVKDGYITVTSKGLSTVDTTPTSDPTSCTPA